jgi:hypothetical protein
VGDTDVDQPGELDAVATQPERFAHVNARRV